MSAKVQQFPASRHLSDRSTKILATSIFKNLQTQGCDPKDIIRISSHMLGLVNENLQTGTSISDADIENDDIQSSWIFATGQ